MTQTSQSETPSHIDLKRYMGSWHVIALIPTPFDSLYNPTEHYVWNDRKKRVDIVYTSNAGSLNGPEKRVPQRAYMVDQTNARWKIKLPWVPLMLWYLIHDITPDYSEVIVGVPSRRFAWIMSKTKTMPKANLDKHKRKLVELGYDVSKLKYATNN